SLQVGHDPATATPRPALQHQSPPVDYGRDHALAGASHAGFSRHGPRAAEDHALLPHGLSRPALQLFRGLDALLDCAKLAQHRPDEADQSRGRKTGGSLHASRPSADRASTEEEEVTLKLRRALFVLPRPTTCMPANPKETLGTLLRHLGFDAQIEEQQLEDG